MAHGSRRNGRPPEHLRLCHIHYPDNVTERVKRISEPHVAPLNDWVANIRRNASLPDGAGDTIPWFDPESAGVAARALLLLQDPSAVAAGNRFISPHNCDDTARNTMDVCAAAGLGYELRCHWNVFPWWVNTDGVDRTRALMSLAAAAPIAARLLPEVLSQFRSLAVIVVAGVGATNGFRFTEAAGFAARSGTSVVEIDSLSALGGFSRNRDRIVSRLAEVTEAIRSGRHLELRRSV